MASITFAIDDNIKSKIEKFLWVNWSEVAREKFLSAVEKQEALERLDKLLRNSKLTEEDIVRMSEKARKGRFRELKSRGLV